MKKLNIVHGDLNIILEICKYWAPNYEIWAYGSRVKGASHSGSDLDLVVYYPNNPDTPFHQLDALRQALHDSDIPFLIDIFDWSTLPKEFKTEIIKTKVVLAKVARISKA